MISDLNKEIISIQYDNNNLPISIIFKNNCRIDYYYDALGTLKSQTVTKEGILMETTDFVGNFVYINGKSAWNNFDEGRVVYTLNGPCFIENYLKDHLGNVRVAYSSATDGTVLSVKQVNTYYPFGMSINSLTSTKPDKVTKNEYLYNGKMFQDELGLNWYNYGARMYDPIIGRWQVTDPLGEKHPDYTPYAYVYNNPIMLIDPLGLDSVYFNIQGSIVERRVNNSPDRFFTRSTEKVAVKTTDYADDGSIITSKEFVDKTVDTEIAKNSDIGIIARTTYAEMRGGDDNAKAIVAESIVNRSNLPDGSYEKGNGTISGIVNKFYDVSKNGNVANDVFKNPEKFNIRNNIEKSAYTSSMGAAVKAYYGNSNVGKGVIFYNSASSTFYDKNPGMQKINLKYTISGIKGLWKL